MLGLLPTPGESMTLHTLELGLLLTKLYKACIASLDLALMILDVALAMI